MTFSFELVCLGGVVTQTKEMSAQKHLGRLCPFPLQEIVLLLTHCHWQEVCFQESLCMLILPVWLLWALVSFWLESFVVGIETASCIHDSQSSNALILQILAMLPSLQWKTWSNTQLELWMDAICVQTNPELVCSDYQILIMHVQAFYQRWLNTYAKC